MKSRSACIIRHWQTTNGIGLPRRSSATASSGARARGSFSRAPLPSGITRRVEVMIFPYSVEVRRVFSRVVSVTTRTGISAPVFLYRSSCTGKKPFVRRVLQNGIRWFFFLKEKSNFRVVSVERRTSSRGSRKTSRGCGHCGFSAIDFRKTRI